MASPDTPRATEPTPSSPRAPAHRDSMLESLGKAITDPVREAADEADDETKLARERATPDPYPDDDDQEPDSPTRSR